MRSLDPDYQGGPSPLLARFTASAEKIAAGDVDGGLAVFVDTLEGAGTWPRLPAMVKQILRDNAYHADRPGPRQPPAVLEGGCGVDQDADAVHPGRRTKGLLPKVLHALAAHVPYSKTAIIPNATHPMFEQAPQKYSEMVLDFLAG